VGRQLAPQEANKRGFSIIPVGPDKKPLVLWKDYQNQKPTFKTLNTWKSQFPGCAWAAITGKVSGVIALDFDKPDGPDTMRRLGIDPHVQTPSGEYHAYVEHPGFPVQTLNGKAKAELGKLYPSMDIKGDGGLVTFYNPDKPYELLRPLNLINFDTLPADLRSYLEGSKDEPVIQQGEATLRQAYRREPREPWGTVAVDRETGPRVDPLKFPDHVITGIIGEFADVYSSHLEAPKEALFMAGLTCLGNEVCGHITLDAEISVPPRLYTAILGKTAETRKSTAIKAAVDFFSSPTFHVCNGVGSAEGFGPVVNSIRHSEDSSSGVNLLLFQDELKQLTQKMKGENSALSPCICSLYEGTRYESSTKNKHTKIENLHLSILGASTIGTYESMFDSGMDDIGLINRLWITPVEGERKFPIPKRIDEEIRKSLKEKLSKVLSKVKAGDPKILEITTSADELFKDWYFNRLEKSLYANRLESYALRLMILLAVNNSGENVDEGIVRMVIDLCDWQLRVRKHYAPIDAENTTAKIEELIRRQLAQHGTLTEGRLRKLTNAKRYGEYFFQRGLNNLKSSGEIIDPTKRKRFSLVKSGS
jgi:hypothetical protein